MYLINMLAIASWVVGMGISALAARRMTAYYTPFYYVNLVFAFIFAGLAFFFGVPHLGATHLGEFTLGHLFIVAFSCAFLAHLFNGLSKQFDFEWLRTFFYIGVLLTVVCASILPIDEDPFFVPVIGMLVIEAFGTGCVWLLAIIVRRLQGKHNTSQTLTSKTSNKYQHYTEAGLSPRDIEFLREQLATAKAHIQTIEQLFNKTAKLRAIELRHNTVKISQTFFKEIVQHPTKLTQAGTFLYKLLPSLEDLLSKYNEVNGHVAKNKQTYLILEKSAATIEQLCVKISEEYIHFHQDDFNELSDEISLAQRNLTNVKDTTTDTIDDLLKGEF